MNHHSHSISSTPHRTCMRPSVTRVKARQSTAPVHKQRSGGWARDWDDESNPAKHQAPNYPSSSAPQVAVPLVSQHVRGTDTLQSESKVQTSDPGKARMTEAGQQLLDQLLEFGLPVEWKRKLAWTANTYGIEKRLKVPARTVKLPSTTKLIIVEGTSDCSAVHQAVHAVVYTCDGSSIKSERAAKHLASISKWPGGVIILTDPDAPGRDLRMFLDDELVQKALNAGGRHPNVRHAFVPVVSATALEKSKWHEEGNVGIENASPAAITRALKASRPSFPKTRGEFTVQELQQLGLANTFDAKQGSGNKLRRELVCDILGIDKCTGKSLTSMLNRFFTREELLAALDKANAMLKDVIVE